MSKPNHIAPQRRLKSNSARNFGLGTFRFRGTQGPPPGAAAAAGIEVPRVPKIFSLLPGLEPRFQPWGPSLLPLLEPRFPRAVHPL